jgi:hypothetical protein
VEDGDSLTPSTYHVHEMMVTLEDVAMILGLSIRGRPITGRVDSALWRERVRAERPESM